jgi:hypothetical protein
MNDEHNQPAVEEDQPAGFLDESPGQKSAMRLLCMQSWWAAFLLTAALPWVSARLGAQALDYYFMLTGAFLLTAFGGKIGQKFFEVKKP